MRHKLHPASPSTRRTSWYTAEPDVAYTLRDEDKEKREAFLNSHA